MNKHEIYEELLRQFVFAISNLSVTSLNPVQVLSAYLSLIREHLAVLCSKLLEISFSTEAEKI